MTDTAPQHVYEAVARDRFHRWGYSETIPDGEQEWVTEQAANFNLRRDVDLVWRLANGGAA